MTGLADKYFSLPAAPGYREVQDNALRMFYQAVYQALKELLGQDARVPDTSVLFRDLEDLDIVSLGSARSVSQVTQSTAEDTEGLPATATGLTTSPIINTIHLSWGGYLPGGAGPNRVAYAEIWRNTSNDRNTAGRVGISTTTTFHDTSAQHGQSYYYWVRTVNYSGVAGEFNSLTGASADLGNTPAASINEVTAAITAAQDGGSTQTLELDTGNFALQHPSYPDAYPFIIANVNGTPNIALNGSVVIGDATIGTAMIQDASISSAKIEDAAINAAKIEDLSVDSAKIANYIESDNYVADVSGWHANKSGFIELEGATVRGEVEASSLVADTIMFAEASFLDLSISTGKINDVAISPAIYQESAIFDANTSSWTTAATIVIPASLLIDDVILALYIEGQTQWHPNMTVLTGIWSNLYPAAFVGANYVSKMCSLELRHAGTTLSSWGYYQFRQMTHRAILAIGASGTDVTLSVRVKGALEYARLRSMARVIRR